MDYIKNLKTKTDELLKEINNTHNAIIITKNGKPTAVIQDPESYQKMKDAISILKILSISEEEIKNNMLISNDQIFDKIKITQTDE